LQWALDVATDAVNAVKIGLIELYRDLLLLLTDGKGHAVE
jgi:hypothetical protein